MRCPRRRRCAGVSRRAIDWLVDAKHRAIVDLVTAVDRVIAARESHAGGMDRRAARSCAGTSYDVALDLQGLMKSAVLARASGAARVVGFSIWHLREKSARPFYSDAARRRRRRTSSARTCACCTRSACDDDEIAFPLADVPSAALDELRRRSRPDRRSR